MSQGVNKVILLGNLGADPEYSVTPSGTATARFGVATSKSWRDSNTGDKKEATEWHKVVLFGKTADIARDYAFKGSKVYIEGENKTSKWTDSDGIERNKTEVIGTYLQILTSRQNQDDF